MSATGFTWSKETRCCSGASETCTPMASGGSKAAKERKEEGNYDYEFQYILNAHSSDWVYYNSGKEEKEKEKMI